MNYREIANNIYFGLYNMGFRFESQPLEAIDMITNLIDDGDYDLKSVVIYIIKYYTK
jgi:hypothetical protein